MLKIFVPLFVVAITSSVWAYDDTDIVCDNGLAIRFDAAGLNPVVVDAEGKTIAPLRECSDGPAPCFTFEQRVEQYNLFWLRMEDGGDIERCPAVEGF